MRGYTKMKRRYIPYVQEDPDKEPLEYETKKEAEKWAKRFKNAYAHRPKFYTSKIRGGRKMKKARERVQKALEYLSSSPEWPGKSEMGTKGRSRNVASLFPYANSRQVRRNCGIVRRRSFKRRKRMKITILIRRKDTRRWTKFDAQKMSFDKDRDKLLSAIETAILRGRDLSENSYGNVIDGYKVEISG